MSNDISIRCRCGEVHGRALDIRPSTGNHIVCYCDDCQTAFYALGRPDLLDEHGGMEVFQISPARVVLDSAPERLGCLRLSPKGLMRWHCRSCSTPIANCVQNPSVPFAGLVVACLDTATREAAMGPITGRINGRFAYGGKPEGAHDSAPIGVLLRAGGSMLGALLRGQARPSPFLDSEDRPRVEPRVLSLEERQRYRAMLGQGPRAGA